MNKNVVNLILEIFSKKEELFKKIDKDVFEYKGKNNSSYCLYKDNILKFNIIGIFDFTVVMKNDLYFIIIDSDKFKILVYSFDSNGDQFLEVSYENLSSDTYELIENKLNIFNIRIDNILFKNNGIISTILKKINNK